MSEPQSEASNEDEQHLNDAQQSEAPNEDEQYLNDNDLLTMKDNWDKWTDFLSRIKILNHLNSNERFAIAMELSLVEFNGDEVIKEGDKGSDFYMIVEGVAIVYQTQSANQSLVRISKLSKGDHFGGIALTFDRPHAATVKAEGELKCVKLTRKTFKSSIQPVLDILKYRTDQYKSFTDLSV